MRRLVEGADAARNTTIRTWDGVVHTVLLHAADMGHVVGLTAHSLAFARPHPCGRTPMRVAVAEDDPDEREVLSGCLREAGYQCYAFDRGEKLLRLGALDRFDALVVDWNLEGTSGGEVLARIRETEKRWVPVLFVGDGRREGDVVVALQQGADGYMTKPIRGLELVARLEAMARRSRSRCEPPLPLLEVDVFSVDLQSRIVRRHSRPLALTPKDFDLAVLFLSNIGRLLSRRQIQGSVWGTHGAVPSRSLDTHVCRIRNRLALTPDQGWELAAVYKFGYRLARLGPGTKDVRANSAAVTPVNLRLVPAIGERSSADKSIARTTPSDQQAGGAEASPVL
jgi:two-component system, OmpR family, response regulator RegX3